MNIVKWKVDLMPCGCCIHLHVADESETVQTAVVMDAVLASKIGNALLRLVPEAEKKANADRAS